jgi:hypothetical protein
MREIMPRLISRTEVTEVEQDQDAANLQQKPTPVTPPTSTTEKPEGDQSTEQQAAGEQNQQTPEPQQPEPPAEDPNTLLLRQISSGIQGLTQRVGALEERGSASAKPNVEPEPPEQANEHFWKDPVGRMRKEIQDQIQPIVELVGGLNENSGYAAIKAQVAAENPAFKVALERAPDLIEQTMEGKPKTAENLRASILVVRGAVDSGLVPGVSFKEEAQNQFANQNQPPANQQPVVTPTTTSGNDKMNQLPPHLRPSAPSPPANPEESKNYRELSENEKRLAREQGMTDQQYLDLIAIPPHEVVTTDIAKKKPEGN